MNKKHIIATLLLIIVTVIASFIAINQWQTATTNPPTLYKFEILNTYPHDTTAFTQGLVYNNGSFFESTGGYGTSTLRKVDLETGQVTKEFKLTDQFFGEGLTQINNELLQLTWQENTGFIYEKNTFDPIGNFSYATEGWGLTYDGSNLIMSDGTSNLYFLNPTTYQEVRQINVLDGNNSITYINELEYVNGDIYANIWLTEKIAIINPQNGQIKGWINMTGLYQPQGSNDVLNGIAYDQQSNRLFVTGKNWPNIYEIKILPI
jgi:glutamine cyclotransferase